MSIERAEKHFQVMDQIYFDLYDKAKKFNDKPTSKNKIALETMLKRFKKHLYYYERTIKEIWIKEDWEGEYDRRRNKKSRIDTVEK